MEKKSPKIPEKWMWIVASELSTLLRGVTYKKNDSSKSIKKNYIPVLRATNIQKNKITLDDLVYLPKVKIKENQLLKKNDVIITTSSGSKRLVGKSAQFTGYEELSFGAFCGLLRPSGLIVPEFFGYFFQSPLYLKQIMERTSGVNINNLKRGDIESLNFPLAPFEDQVRIVTRIEELFSQLDAGVRSLQVSQTQLEQYRLAILKQAYTGKLTEKWRTNQSGSRKEALITSKEVPEDWFLTSLHEVCQIDVGHAFKSEKFSSDGIKLLRGKNIQPGKLVWDDTKYYPLSELDKFSKLLLNEDDIILAMDRPIISTGLKLAKVKSNDTPSLLVQRMARIIPNNRVTTDYLYYSMQLPSFITHLLGKQTGTQLPHISKKNIITYEIPVPSIQEQNIIVDTLESMLSIIHQNLVEITKSMTKCSIFKQSILKKAFEGRLVHQNPNDEPSSALLERIKAQRGSK